MAAKKTTQPRREDLPPDVNLCEYCTAKCCRYLALPLPRRPKTWTEFDEVRWFLSHEKISVFVDKGEWYILVHNECQHLLHDGRCGIYEIRPQICRDYKTTDCEYDDDFTYEKIFENDRQMYEYAEAMIGPRPGSAGLQLAVV